MAIPGKPRSILQIYVSLQVRISRAIKINHYEVLNPVSVWNLLNSCDKLRRTRNWPSGDASSPLSCGTAQAGNNLERALPQT